MKHLCFFNSLNFWGGGEKLHLEFALKFRQFGYRVTVACAAGSPLDEACTSHSIPTVHFTVGSLSFLSSGKLANASRFFTKEDVDTVVFSSSQDMKFAAKAGFLAGVARRVYLRGLAVPVKRSRINKKCLATYVTHVVANSEATKKLIGMNFPEEEIQRKLHVIYHGIELEDFELPPNQTQKVQTDGRVIIGNAGRLTAQKGQHLLIQIAEILKTREVNFKLLIAGSGELEQELRTQIGELDLYREVELLGFVKDVPGFMHQIDIFALSSLWEGFGFVIVEAMACKKPVVAFDVSSNPEIIDHEHTGYLVKEGDLEKFADYLQLLVEEAQRRQEMGRAGRRSVETRFLLDDRARELEQYLLNA